MNRVVMYTPRLGEARRIEASHIELLRMQELPQLVLLGSARVEVLPVSGVECIRACSRANGLCVELGSGSCIESYTPLSPGLPPAWMPRIEYKVEVGERSLLPGVSLREAEPRMRGVYAPLILYLEPLSARRIRLEDGELLLWAGCVEAPSKSLAFIATGDEPVLLDVEPGLVRIEGDARTYQVARCRRGVFSTLVRIIQPQVNARLRLQGDIVLLEATEESGTITLTVWNPHTHPVKLEVYTDAPVRNAKLCTVRGCEQLEAIHGSMLVTALPGEVVAGLEIQLKRASPLLRGKR